MKREYIEKFYKTGKSEYLNKYYEDDSYQNTYKKIKPKWKSKFQIMSTLMKLRKGQRVLDVGCASKMFKPYVIKYRAIYKGVDIAKGFKPDYVTSAETLKGIPNDSFDWIVLSDVLEHLTNPYKAIKTARRVGNKIIAVVPNWYRLERFGFKLPRSTKDRHIQKMAPSAWLSMFKKAGWKDISYQGFYYIPSISFYPFIALLVIDRLFLTFPFRILSSPIDKYLANKPFIKDLGQEMIIIAYNIK